MERYFEWDEHKAVGNVRKHGIAFAEAARVFDDPLAVSRPERLEGGEQRWQTIGMIDVCLVVVVAHTVRTEATGAETLRIISARRANRKERKRYEQG